LTKQKLTLKQRLNAQEKVSKAIVEGRAKDEVEAQAQAETVITANDDNNNVYILRLV